MPEPLCLGLTGGIGSGKSAALDAFARRGAAVLSSDAVVHRLYEDPVIVDAVRARFGAVGTTPLGPMAPDPSASDAVPESAPENPSPPPIPPLRFDPPAPPTDPWARAR